MTNAIEIHHVTRNFGRITALDDVSFTVPEHSILGLLGRNGAGKTTAMSIMAGQDRASAGQVKILGHSPFEHAAMLSRISYVRDNQRYPDDYKLHHVLRIAPEFAPHWGADFAAELADAFRIPATTRIKKLSRGQLSSIAIVLGLASRAPITLLDEPYLGLDVTGRALFHTMLLRDYEEHPRTVVLSTHLIEESAALFDRVIILDQGTVVIDDEADAARDHAFVLSGARDAVDEVLGDNRVLERQSIGGLASVTAEGAINASLRELATLHGVQLARVSLQELVSGYGANDATPSESKVA